MVYGGASGKLLRIFGMVARSTGLFIFLRYLALTDTRSARLIA